MAFLYWVRTADIFDISDGYVGVTSKQPQTRLNEHNKKGRFCAFGAKDDLIIDILYEGDVGECFIKEKNLRPCERMGWNIAPGGEGGYKGNHYVSKHGMPWNDKAQERRRQMIKEGKISIKGYCNNPTARLKKRAPWRYTIKNLSTNEVHTVYGREGIASLIKSAVKGSKINRFLKGLNEEYELVGKQALARS